VRTCVLCHTAGAEDLNDPGIAGGTPGTSVEFRVMIHRIHNAAHLPSVLGVGTRTDGSGLRDYARPPTPYVLVDAHKGATDYSHVHFPVFPSLTTPHLRDMGHAALLPAQQAQEDEIRRGVVTCAKCHGDPDGAGPLTAPAQGSLHETQPSRQACGACHDDVDWSQPYEANGVQMPGDLGNGTCALCHEQTGSDLSVRDAHLHPLLNPAYNPGLRIAITSVVEAGVHNGNGKIDPGEKVAATLTVTDDAGNPVAPGTLSSISCVISGPTSNYNLVLNGSIPVGHPAFAGPSPYVLNVPQAVVLEVVGTSTAAAGEAFVTSRTPHLAIAGAATTVFSRTGNGAGGSTTTAAAGFLDNYVDVLVVAGFAANDFVAVDDGSGLEEYAQVGLVEGNRLWLRQPLRFAHPAGVAVQEVVLTTRATPATYSLNAATGTITEVGTSFGTNTRVIVSYTSDFVMPAVYPPPLNDSPDLGESFGEWKGKAIVPGTYTLDVYGVVNRNVVVHGETNAYRGTSDAGDFDFLVGSAVAIEPYQVISEAQNCYACHDDLWFHGGGRRGFGTCIICHGDAGGEDRPRYASAAAPPTPGVSISFREMIHKIHMGADLWDAATYQVAGFSGGTSFGDVHFPAIPDGVKQCVRCHGNDAWREPTSRDHPTQQTTPTRVWRIVCGSCHSSPAAHAHIDGQTVGGVEACAVCHGPGRDHDVARVHFAR
jgi:hypothetical protein